MLNPTSYDSTYSLIKGNNDELSILTKSGIKMISKKINLYSIIKGYLNILLVFILYTLGYAAGNYFLENTAALKSMSFSSEIKIFLAIGA